MNYRKMIGLGVAGNIAGHLDQAGESIGFESDKEEENDAPKGLFPFYIPSNEGKFFEVYPISSDTISFPEVGDNLQLEPELGIICKVHYENKLIKSLTPLSFGAFNDCSIRKLDVPKLSMKKNWGSNSKGISETLIDIDKFSQGGILDNYHIVSYIRREGTLIQYGQDSPVTDYSYLYDELLTWMVSKMNTQSDEGILEPILNLFSHANYPDHAIIGIGATNYTDFGKTNFLKKGDETLVVIYSNQVYDINKIESMLESNRLIAENLSVLHQTVR